MQLTATDLRSCAPTVSPVTMERVVQVESGGDPLALNVNGARIRLSPPSVREAAATARSWISAGYSVDIGLAQINSRNLAALGYTIEDALDPCMSLRGGGRILSADYAAAANLYGDGQRALLAALSAYNTGTFWRGFANGYVARYVPGIAISSHAGETAHSAPRPFDPYSADTEVTWDVR